MRTRFFGRLERGSIALLAPLVMSLGCATPTNPDFSPPREVVEREWRRMRREPVGLGRPLVVLDGWRQPDISAWLLARTLRRLTGARRDDVMAVSFLFRARLLGMAEEVVRMVDRRWPSEDPDWTVEVDVVGFSMGGIVARLAAMERPESKSPKRLRIRRLYTLATPHRGASLARYIALDRAARDMRAGSAFMAGLDAALERADYELVCYAHTRDVIVGATNTAPPGEDPIWIDGRPPFSHLAIKCDRRVLVDLALRLRGEAPLAAGASPPPRD